MTQALIPPGYELLLALAAELLDAHVDTVELLLGWADEVRWRAHLDYLRALVRTTERILAAGLSAEETSAANSLPGAGAIAARPPVWAEERR